MIFNEILHGTQYYRAPTPLADEWETDIARFDEIGIDAFQIRINWRWNERKEGEYDFSDVDRLLELAEKYNRKVIMKFLLECAPQYVFDKYGGTRIGPKGELIRGGSHGAFYGGWRPCFTNPYVQNSAVKFVEKVAERYADNKNIVLWNVWNEIRNKPLGECFCDHCRKGFGKYLKNKFKTIENLNAFYGTAEDDFETIALPAMAHGFWDIYEFKKFKGSAELYNYLKFVYDGIRRYDKARPIMAHTGITSAFQRHLGDVCDDFTVSKAVDFWGTSVPCDCDMSTHEKRLDYMMVGDFLRAVDENYFAHEIYPGLGMFKHHYDTPFDLNFKIYGALSSGAKGIIYWQYRAERVGHEQDCAGLVRADGSPREVLKEVTLLSKDLKKHSRIFASARVKPAEIAIVYDFNSQLMSEIEDSCGADFTFDMVTPTFQYRNGHAGFYRLVKNLNYAVDYISVTEPQKFKNYKVLYFPYYNMLNHEIVPFLKEFSEGGGTILADEGFGLRQENTWFNPYDIKSEDIMKAKLIERRKTKGETLKIGDEDVVIKSFKSEYTLKGGTPILYFNDWKAALQSVKSGNGNIYLFGFPIGSTYYDNNYKSIETLIDDILKKSDIKPLDFSDARNNIYEKRLVSNNKEIIFIFNASNEEKRFPLSFVDGETGGSGNFNNGYFTVPAMSSAYFIGNKVK